MDSWKYLSEGRGSTVCLSEELDFQFDSHGSKTKLNGCEMKSLFNVESYPLVSNTQALERLDFMGMGFSDEIRRSYSREPSGEVLSDGIVTDFRDVGSSPFGEEKDLGSNSKISSGFVQSDSLDFSFVDLKLGRLEDGGVVNDGGFSSASVAEVSDVSSSPAKRARSTTVYLQSPCCQVLGCNKDLSSHKGYYKRHKVCDEHTRTARVIVQGIEQRFCQQCSRFHQVAEFDEGKRSCRRRLAAHNKRRRKPRFTSESGSGIIDFSSSDIYARVMPTDDLSRRYEHYKWVDKHVKDEDSIKNSDVFLRISVGERLNNLASCVKRTTVGMTTANILNSSNVQQTSRALSLLSPESHDVSSQMFGTSVRTPFFDEGGHAGSNPGNAINISAACNHKDMLQSGPHAPGIFPMINADNVESTMITQSDGNAPDMHLPGDGISREENIINTSLGRGIILDLLQLSSHLQRVEHQRHSTESEAG